MKRPKSPCKRDCEGRSAECRKTCEAYQAHEKALMAFYQSKRIDHEMTDARITMDRRRHKKGCFI